MACRKCSSTKLRHFQRVCDVCGVGFYDSNNKSRNCSVCDLVVNPKYCTQCGCGITRGHKRCNSCEARQRPQRKGWRRYLYEGIRYRSKWEVEVASIFFAFGISFEYERFDVVTKTYPDFYIHDLQRYFEIHPDYFGPKVIPPNGIILKTLPHARAAAYAIAFRLYPTKIKLMFNQQPIHKQELMYKHMCSTAVYMRQLLFERDGK
jgi:hypothetical protein